MSNIPIEERTFDWTANFDERSRQYPVRAAIRKDIIKRKNKKWRTGTILDQEKEGSCVGNAWTGELLATPVAVDINRTKAVIPRKIQDLATFIYQEARKIDDFPGEDHVGTSVIAGAKVIQTLGFLKEYRWAFGIDDVVDSIFTKGPVIIGTDWYEDMATTDKNGFLKPKGGLVGGHAYLVVGYAVEPHGQEDALIVQNSWGEDWGNNGLGFISVSDMSYLLQQGGEACVPTKRSFGRA